MNHTFIHMADVHLDSPFYYLSDSSKRQIRQNEQRIIFKNAMMEAKEKKVDFVLICGDFLDHDSTTLETLRYVDEVFSICHPLPVFLIVGNHDSRLLKKYSFSAENVVLLGDQIKIARLEKYAIYALSQEDEVSLNPQEYNILLWHGSVTQKDENPLPEKFKTAGFDYIALGHYHRFQNVSTSTSMIYYSGSLIARGFDETGEKGYLLIETIPETKVHFCKMEQRQYHQLTFKVEELPYPEVFKMADCIAKVIDQPDDHYFILIKGKRNSLSDLNLSLFSDAIQSCAFYIKVSDETTFDASLTVQSAFLKCFSDKMDHLIASATSEQEKEHFCLAKELGSKAIMNGEDFYDHS